MSRIPLLFLAACASGPPETAGAAPSTDRALAIRAVRLADRPELGSVDIFVDGSRIAAIRESDRPATRWVTPSFVDAHVHLAFDPRSEALLDGGIAAVVDLAMPERHLDDDHGPLRVVASGPMLTAPRGYPTESWGADGYGMIVRRADDAGPSVDRLHRSGARAVKIPIDRGPTLDDDVIRAIVDRAHHHGMKVFVHALSDADANRAARLGADVLAHTPIQRLSDETVALWKDRAVVSTLAAFGSGGQTKDNLRRLARAGATVLYGTDFGNARTAGINPVELERMLEAGLSADEILAAATSTPAEYFGFEDLGALREGRRASFVVTNEDPRVRLTALADPLEVWVDGKKR